MKIKMQITVKGNIEFKCSDIPMESKAKVEGKYSIAKVSTAWKQNKYASQTFK